MSDRPVIVFDLDGTLIDSAPDIHDTANKVFQANGLDGFSFDVVKGFIGNGVGVLVARLLASQGLPSTGDLHREMVSAFIRNYEQAVDLTVLYPGVTSALEAFSARGHRLGICTNKPEAPARAVLRHFRIEHHFAAVIGGDSLPQSKPDPAPLLAAIAALGGGRALFVGDSEVDAETAKSAEIPLALFSQGYRKAPVDSLGARLIFDDFGALPQLVAHLGQRF